MQIKNYAILEYNRFKSILSTLKEANFDVITVNYTPEEKIYIRQSEKNFSFAISLDLPRDFFIRYSIQEKGHITFSIKTLLKSKQLLKQSEITRNATATLIFDSKNSFSVIVKGKNTKARQITIPASQENFTMDVNRIKGLDKRRIYVDISFKDWDFFVNNVVKYFYQQDRFNDLEILSTKALDRTIFKITYLNTGISFWQSGLTKWYADSTTERVIATSYPLADIIRATFKSFDRDRTVVQMIYDKDSILTIEYKCRQLRLKYYIGFIFEN